ncbi:MAG: ribonuclease P protein component [Candidatus Sungbacteria bacterium]|nr:ribonuclease P protein component [Candidatus Sungbacteria bacterium]
MNRAYGLRGAKDFRLLFRYGTRVQSPAFQLLWRLNRLSHARLAFIAPKAAVKLAVARNRLRRMAREWVRKNILPLSRPADVAVIFKKGAANVPTEKLYEEFDRVFRKLSLPDD